jgi:hypothetical protein
MAVHGVSNNGLDAVGVKGESSSNIGVYGISSAINGEGVYGSASSTNGKGISGNSSGLDGYGVYGYAGGTDGIGVYGYGSWTGVRAVGGVYGLWVSGNGSFDNNVYISGDLTVIGSCCAAGAGSFRIDHPTDPENKYLVQTAVQGADMMSIYNGNATTDAKGEAVVALPAYIEALNKDFRYQLTVMGQFAQAIVAEEIKNNRFTIKTDKPNVKVSWQVTGIRQDPYAKAHPIEVEVEKEADEQGKYLHPKEWGQPESKGVGYEERQRMENDTQKPQEPKQAPGR